MLRNRQKAVKRVCGYSPWSASERDNVCTRYLATTLVWVGMNKKNFKPAVNAIKEPYYSKFRGGGDSPSDAEE